MIRVNYETDDTKYIFVMELIRKTNDGEIVWISKNNSGIFGTFSHAR